MKALNTYIYIRGYDNEVAISSHQGPHAEFESLCTSRIVLEVTHAGEVRLLKNVDQCISLGQIVAQEPTWHDKQNKIIQTLIETGYLK